MRSAKPTCGVEDPCGSVLVAFAATAEVGDVACINNGEGLVLSAADILCSAASGPSACPCTAFSDKATTCEVLCRRWPMTAAATAADVPCIGVWSDDAHLTACCCKPMVRLLSLAEADCCNEEVEGTKTTHELSRLSACAPLTAALVIAGVAVEEAVADKGWAVGSRLLLTPPDTEWPSLGGGRSCWGSCNDGEITVCCMIRCMQKGNCMINLYKSFL